MDTLVEGPDVCDDLQTWCEDEKAWDIESDLFQGWWSKVRESASLVIRKPLNYDAWEYLLWTLANVDVSRLEHLLLTLSEVNWRLCDRLVGVFANREFTALKTLRVLERKPYEVLEMGVFTLDLARALEKGHFPSLHSLALPAACDFNVVLDALSEAALIPQFTSISISFDQYRLQQQAKERAKLYSILKSGSFSSLQHMDLSHLNNWKTFPQALKSRENLPNMTSFRLAFSRVQLVDLFTGSENWFGSLQHLALYNCDITSEELCCLEEEIIAHTAATELALKSLDLHENWLDGEAIGALVRLAGSHRLPHLQELDLSANRGPWETDAMWVVSLIQSIQKGDLASLRKLNWEHNRLEDVAAKAIVKAIFDNHAITTEINLTWDHVSDISLKTKLKTYRERNVRLAALREKLGEELADELGDFVPCGQLREELADELGDFVPLTHAKVFLCGYAEVGKTTLRKALLRHFGKRTKFMWETRHVKEPRTRGIEISRIAERNKTENTTLVLWDLAGQEEYHVLHGTFLSDLGFVGGKATSFVIVLRAPFEDDVKGKLWYWLRFVASSSLRHVKRHVVIVLNCFQGKTCTEDDRRLWKALIESFAAMFGDLLDIHPEPFIIDVRKAAPVQPLKHHLFTHARTLLQGADVPRICFEVNNELKRWVEDEDCTHLPILTWKAFEEWWKVSSVPHNHFSTRALKIAASYLHEIGEIIYFEEKDPNSPQSGNRSIVVPNPEWFCRRLVGELLLPKSMLQGEGSIKVRDDGSISLIMFKAFFQDLLVEGTQCDDVISMLELVGLCYRKSEEIIVPALIRKDDYRSIDWEGKVFHGVMGRCLAVKDTDKNIIPVTLFRRLQVELAQDAKFGGRGDSDYRVGNSFLSFKLGELVVLIQFDVDHSDPADDRIDILVKSAMCGDPTDVSSARVECICEIMDKLEGLCATCCDGLTYDIKVIEPSSAAERADRMSHRKLMGLKEVMDLVMKGNKYLSWNWMAITLSQRRFFQRRS